MGCASAKPDINDIHPNFYQVMNVNEMGQVLSPGELEIAETELVLHQKGKEPTRWPLRCLRKYGFDSDLFTFECGRRCPTGAGIYAFRCRKAEQLFNMLQHNIQVRNLSDENTNLTNVNTHMNEHLPNTNNAGPPVHRRLPSQPEGYITPTQAPPNVRLHPILSKPGSLTSNGPNSPTLSPPLNNNARDFEHNNNKRGSLVSEHPYTNTSALDTESNMPNYINLNVTSPTLLHGNYVNIPDANGQNSHLYMNVNTSENSQHVTNVTKDIPNNIRDRPSSESDIDDKHCYANIDTAELENLRPILNANLDTTNSSSSVPQTPTYVTVKEVNYAELDLITTNKDTTPTLPVLPESPTDKKSYVTIDFNKTNALSGSINPRIDVEEGSRKTRHNSTIGELPRHSNSLSD